jgi:general secretion pathway protein G
MILSHPRSRSARRRSAFTLLEVLVVVAIILVLASVATVAVMNVLEENKDDAAKMNAVNLAKAAQTYMIKHDGAQPQSLEEVIEYVEGHDRNKLIDPWGQPYQLGYNESNNPYVYTTNPKTQVVIRSDTSNKTK